MTLVALAQDIETGDLAADARGIRLALGAEAVVVLVSNRLRQQPGDDPRAPSDGLPLKSLLGKYPSPVALARLAQQRASEASAVDSVPSCRAAVDGDALVVEVRVRTSEGLVDASFEVA